MARPALDNRESSIGTVHLALPYDSFCPSCHSSSSLTTFHTLHRTFALAFDRDASILSRVLLDGFAAVRIMRMSAVEHQLTH